MDALISWGVALVSAHPKWASWLMIVVAIDNFLLKPLKNAFKLNIPDNIFDQVGDIIGKILSKATLPK